MPIISVKSSLKSELIDITSDISKNIPPEFKDGICHIFCMHTTAGLTINENADPAVRSDIIAMLDETIPWESPLYNHFEGNSAAHLKASMMGFSQTVPVQNGKLQLGTWQGIYFCEFDGPRNRSVQLQFISEFFSQA